MGFDVSGLVAGLKRAEAAMSRGAEQGLVAGAEHVLESADVPRLTGALAASGHVESDGDTASVVFDKPYAAAVHEYEDPFLERAVVGERGKVGEIIADRVRQVTT